MLMTEPLALAGFAFSEVVEILAKLYSVHPDRRDTFVSRLQQLQKLGLPGAANVGRGAKVRYVNWQLADLAVMLDLIACGLTPATLKQYFRPNDRNYLGIYSSGGYGWHVEQSLQKGKPALYFLMQPNTLWYLERPKDDQEDAPMSRQDKGRSSENVLSELAKAPALTIDMTAQLRRLREAVNATYPDRIGEMDFHLTRTGTRDG